MIDYAYITRLQGLRDKMWADSDAAMERGHYATAHRCMAQASGVSAAITALTTYDMDVLTVQRMEEALGE